MRHGTLAEYTPGRVLVCFENTLGYLPPESAVQFRALSAVRARRKAMSLWRLREQIAQGMTHFQHRTGKPIDIVHYLGEEFTPHLTAWLDRYYLPHWQVLSYADESELDAVVRHQLMVERVVHADPSRPFLFGSKGMAVRPGRWDVQW